MVCELQNCSQRAQNDQAVNDHLQEYALLVFRAHEHGVGRFFDVVVWLACFHVHSFFRFHLFSSFFLDFKVPASLGCVIQLGLVSGPTSWKWTPLWAPTSIAPCLSEKMPNAVFSLSNFALL